MPTPYQILFRKRAGEALSEGEIRAVVAGTTDGSWSDAQLGAFLMAAVIRGLDPQETRTLTLAMLESGEQWALRDAVPTVGDKHSTGGIGDKVSLILGPLLAVCGQPVAMLTGRGLGHTGGTADKLETIPGLDQALDRQRSLALLDRVGLAVGMATEAVAPADRRLYALRDVTATVDSLPLITGSILSKKLATGTAGVVFDIKTGDGAFLPEIEEGRRLGRLLTETSTALGCPARAIITDMSQPLGRWVGHAVEVRETLQCLEGEGPDDLMEVTYTLCEAVAALVGTGVDRPALERAITSGAAREHFDRWATAQGASAAWLRDPQTPTAPEEIVLAAPHAGVLAQVANRRLGELLAEAGGGRILPGDAIDPGVALRAEARLGDDLAAGDPLARLYLRRPDDGLVARFRECFTMAAPGTAVAVPALIRERILPAAS
jgi:pyrimidine-nucleoside phosphorylase